MPTKKKQRAPHPSESYASRAERGRKPVLITLSNEARARLDALVAEQGTTKSAVVESLILPKSGRQTKKSPTLE